MLALLNISNIALIDELRVEFDAGLNLLTGETGSGKSIIVDSLGLLIGGRFTADLLKQGAERSYIEGLFIVNQNSVLTGILSEAGIVEDTTGELIIRRELSANGRNKTFINNQLATQSLLRELRPFLVDIHGQGDQQTLFQLETHRELLDAYGGLAVSADAVASAYRQWTKLKAELQELETNEAEKFQLVDILKFQINELETAQLALGEDERLEEERRRLLNVEKLTALSRGCYNLIYEDEEAALARLRRTRKDIAELAEFESSFGAYLEGLEVASLVLEDLAFALRDFSDKLEYSPGRLAEIEDRLAELSRVKRKYGRKLEAALEHLARSEDRLRQIEHSDERANEIKADLAAARSHYLELAGKLHKERLRGARKFEKAVEASMAEVALAGARFQVQITSGTGEPSEESFSVHGIGRIEFLFSANVGEAVKPLAKVASGGEASRLMLVLKTVANALEFPRTIVFDEIDAGIGGRVSEAVGIKLKKLAESNQVLCVTHQPQVARFADTHLTVQKEATKGKTTVNVVKLDRRGRVEELARMLTGAEITESARRHARELLKT